jgi:hypothetical protein
MKSSLIALLFFLSVPVSEQTLLKELRSNFGSFDKKESLCKNYLAKLEEKSPLSTTLKGYKGVLTMTMAEHVSNPYTKYKYFNKGKDILEEAIKNDPFDVELRYLRYVCQYYTPDFVDYKDQMAQDKAYMKSRVDKIQDETLKNMILEALNLK